MSNHGVNSPELSGHRFLPRRVTLSEDVCSDDASSSRQEGSQRGSQRRCSHCTLAGIVNISSFGLILLACVIVLVLEPFERSHHHPGFQLCTVTAFFGMVCVPILVFYISVKRTAEHSPRTFGTSFGRLFFGLPFALFTAWEIVLKFSGFSSTSLPFLDVRVNGFVFNCSHALLFLAAVCSVAHVSLGALEIDSRICNAVHRQLELSVSYKIQHLIFRFTETVSHLTILIIIIFNAQTLVSPIYDFDAHADWNFDTWGLFFSSVSVFVSYTVWAFAVLLVSLANRCSKDMPKEKCLSSVVVAYTSLAINPFYFLSQSPYSIAGRRASTILFLSWYFQLAAVCGLALYVLPTWPLHAVKASEKEFPEHMQLMLWYVSLFQLLLSTVVFHAIPLLNRKFRRTMNESRVQLLPYETGGMGEVQTSAEAGLSQFLLSRCGGGMLMSESSLRPVNVQEISIERLLGIGSFGLVVQCRLERRDGQMLKRSKQELFALKLQTIDPPKDQQWNRAYTVQHRRSALGERTVYQKIWQDADEATGQLGHPFIVRLACASNWPEGRQLFYAGTDEAVLFNEISNFHYGLMMEYLPHGSLAQFIPTHLRRGLDSRHYDGLHWLVLIRRFAAEVLLALDFLHNTKHVVHRDLKPANVLIAHHAPTDTLHVKLSDFGFSKVLEGTTTPNLGGESAVSIAGSPYYTAPEMVKMMVGGARFPTDWSLDVFSFGMVVFVLVFGAEMYTKMDDIGGGWKWVRVAIDTTLPLDFPEEEQDRIQWWPADRIMHPHPDMAKGSWEHDLQRLELQPQCPQHAIEVIRDCTLADPHQRPSIAQLRSSELFGRQGNIPAIDWLSLERLDL